MVAIFSCHFLVVSSGTLLRLSIFRMYSHYWGSSSQYFHSHDWNSLGIYIFLKNTIREYIFYEPGPTCSPCNEISTILITSSKTLVSAYPWFLWLWCEEFLSIFLYFNPRVLSLLHIIFNSVIKNITLRKLVYYHLLWMSSQDYLETYVSNYEKANIRAITKSFICTVQAINIL